MLKIINHDEEVSISVLSCKRSITPVYKSFKNLDPTLTIGGFKKCIEYKKAIICYNLYNYCMIDFLIKFDQLIETLREIIHNGGIIKMRTKNGRQINLPDLEFTLDFHNSYQPKHLAQRFASFFDSLIKADWFLNKGNLIHEDKLTSIEKPQLNNRNWLCIQIGIVERITNKLVKKHDYHPSFIQPFYKQLMPEILKIVHNKLKSIPRGLFDEYNKPEGLIMASCIEQYFLDELSLAHSINWTNWLLKSFVPVGWEGDFPEGSLIVW